MSRIEAVDVFTPNDFPTYTYISRTGDDVEERFRNALATRNAVISISGPSKSGKTVLVDKVVGTDNIIKVSGAEIQSADALWARVLDWCEAPSSTQEQFGTTSGEEGSVAVSADAKVPFLAKAGGTAAYKGTSS